MMGLDPVFRGRRRSPSSAYTLLFVCVGGGSSFLSCDTHTHTHTDLFVSNKASTQSQGESMRREWEWRGKKRAKEKREGKAKGGFGKEHMDSAGARYEPTRRTALTPHFVGALLFSILTRRCEVNNTSRSFRARQLQWTQKRIHVSFFRSFSLIAVFRFSSRKQTKRKSKKSVGGGEREAKQL